MIVGWFEQVHVLCNSVELFCFILQDVLGVKHREHACVGLILVHFVAVGTPSSLVSKKWNKESGIF